MEQTQKFTFLSIFYQNVASPSADDLPGHRITLQAEDEASCSTSHELQSAFFFSWRDAEAYACGVRHVAPSPPGEARAGGAMLRATGTRRRKKFRSDRDRPFSESALNSERLREKIFTFFVNFHGIF